MERQRTNQIEDMTVTGQVGKVSGMSFNEKKSDGISNKTFQISKSQQASAYAIIENRNVASRGNGRGATNMNLGA